MEPIFIVVILIMFFAAVVQGIAGFGRALVAAPLTALILPADETVVLMIVIGIVGGAVMVLKTYRYLKIRKILPMIIFGIIGSIAGVQILSILPVKELKIIMGAFIILSAVILSTGFRVKIKNEKFAYSAAGFIGGLTNGAISFGGPPTVLFLQNQNEEKNIFRANLSMFFLIIGTAGMINLMAIGMLTNDLWVSAAYLVVPCIAGTFLGNYLSHKLNEGIFRKIVLGILFIAGVMAIVMSLV